MRPGRGGKVMRPRRGRAIGLTALGVSVLGVPVLCMLALGLLGGGATPAAAAPMAAPCPDPDWAPHLPAGWRLGPVSGLAADAAGDLWLLQRPAAGEKAAGRPVIELNPAGQVRRAWGGPARPGGPAYDWPESPHSIALDAAGRVWISGNGRRDGQILAFDRDGRFLRQIGHPASGRPASGDVTHLGRPTGIAVDSAAQEVFVADGYANRRVIVFDSETGAFRRLWGGDGGRPADRPADAAAAFAPPVHCIRLGPPGTAAAGLVFVCDRRHDRIRIFRPDGRLAGTWPIAPAGRAAAGGGDPAMGTAWDLAFAPRGGPVAVADGGSEVVHLLRPADGTPEATIDPRRCGLPGFRWVHAVAIDGAGHLFTGEVTGRRVLRFTLPH